MNPADLLRRSEITRGAADRLDRVMRSNSGRRQITNPGSRQEVLDAITGGPGQLALPLVMGAGAASQGDDDRPGLSQRQRDIARLLMRYGNSQIGY